MTPIKAWKKKIVAYLLASLMVVSIMLSTSTPVQAYSLTASDFMKVSGYKSFNKDGKLYMSFNLARDTGYITDILFSAKVVNSAGKTVFTWKQLAVKNKDNGGTRRDFAADYSKLPAGQYTFILRGETARNLPDIGKKAWNWKYTINHKGTPKVSFKSYEKVRVDGEEKHKFTISQSGGKGRTVVMRVFDSKGEMVTLQQRKLVHNAGTAWFYWNGDSDIGSGYRCKSGTYTVQVYFSGEDGKVIEKEYNLKIN